MERVVLCTVLALAAGCGGTTRVDPITGDPPFVAGPSDAGNPFSEEAGFPAGSCPAVCGQPFGAGHAFTSMQDLAATLRGRWVYCSGHPMGEGINGFPTDVVGAEFASDAVFWLVRNAANEVVRGVGPQYALPMTYSCVSGVTCFDMYGHFNDGDFGGSLSDCPRKMTIGYATSNVGEYIAIP